MTVVLSAGGPFPPEDDLFRPSEFTAMLIDGIRSNRHRIRGRSALEIGCGSGVVMAALADAGATTICGVDIEAGAIGASERTLRAAGYLDIAELHHGDMWAPVRGRTFGVIVANLPQAASNRPLVENHHLSWNYGGENGRALLDRFLEGVAAHLTPDGWAMITHIDLIGVPRTKELLAASGLEARIATTRLLTMTMERLRTLTVPIVAPKLGNTMIVYGKHAFSEVHVIEATREPEGL